MLDGMIPSIGSVGDALDNALAETTIGLYKTECIRDGSPFRNGPLETLADVEKITSAWVWWYNTSRLAVSASLFCCQAEAVASQHVWRDQSRG
jgi:putative transposase